MSSLKNIVWVGAGNTGLPVLKKVLASGQFNIRLLVHNPISTYRSLPSKLSSINQVDFTDHSVLVQHLQGQDAIIVFSSFLPGHNFDTKHISLANAAVDAGVRYFIPSEWALDTAGIMGSTSDRYGPTLPTNMVLAPKRVSHNYLLCRAAEKKICFAAIYAGVLIESCINNGFIRLDFNNRIADLPDHGVSPFPATSLATLSKAIVSLLNDPSKICNRFYHISDGVLTQQEMVRIIQAEFKLSWKKTSFSIENARLAALENMGKGIYGLEEFVGTLVTPFFGGLQVFTKLDNDILDIGDDTVDLREEVIRLARERMEEIESQRISHI